MEKELTVVGQPESQVAFCVEVVSNTMSSVDSGILLPLQLAPTEQLPAEAALQVLVAAWAGETKKRSKNPEKIRPDKNFTIFFEVLVSIFCLFRVFNIPKISVAEKSQKNCSCK